MKRITLQVCMLLSFCSTAFSQSKPFEADIKTIQAYDRIYQTPDNPILFAGSSSIRKWDDLQEAFGAYNVINRGIGGAYINDITVNLKDLVFAYKFRQLVLYVGENDLVRNDETPDSILNRTKVLYNAIRAKLPELPVIYIGLKPSPSRDQYRSKLIAANKLLKEFFAGEKNVKFLDVYPLMLNKDGSYRKEIFQNDMLHMNRTGYEIWEKAIRPLLKSK
ncbi:GDSL-type esterase/lipase family protein [Pedobacter sp. L105]|uniref:GDSL-type esterase/lipase family protein n=1 Tax=Pedobacter sp. L105 TaxID=1641871 RepID=UPI00131EBA63|nr:GDSL-type esterase/lipase family protein [Pedobacter sp. L105]